jgi:peptidoglycan-N-acetylglucosamine deacetylase
MSQSLEQQVEEFSKAIQSLDSCYEFIPDFSWPDDIRIAVNFTCDFDAMLFRRVMDEPPSQRAKGEFGGRVGIWRLIELFDAHDVKATFFTPGRICELYPDSLKAAAASGHEIAEHMWQHIPPSENDEWAQDHLIKSTTALEKIAGKKPVGTRSGQRRDLLLQQGYLYDSHGSASHLPYYIADDEKGSNCLLNLPFHFAIDDAMYYSFSWLGSKNQAQRITDSDRVLELWWDGFLDQYEAGGYLNICLHPFVSGRAQRIAMLDELISRMKKVPGVWFPTCEIVARYCLENFPPKNVPPGATQA